MFSITNKNYNNNRDEIDKLLLLLSLDDSSRFTFITNK